MIDFTQLLIEAGNRAGMIGGAPALRFFTPTQAFWELMLVGLGGAERARVFLELGAGTGETAEEAQAMGLLWSGCDVRAGCEAQMRGVHRMNALTIPIKEGSVVLACRPDHSGWVSRALERALDEGATAIYVGLDRNYEGDLGDLLDREHQVVRDVGQEEEHAWVFWP